MKQYEVVSGPLTLPAGTVIGLNAGQAKRRSHVLDRTGEEGQYLSLDQVQFKQGEILQLDEGGLSKAQQGILGAKPGRPKKL